MSTSFDDLRKQGAISFETNPATRENMETGRQEHAGEIGVLTVAYNSPLFKRLEVGDKLEFYYVFPNTGARREFSFVVGEGPDVKEVQTPSPSNPYNGKVEYRLSRTDDDRTVREIEYEANTPIHRL